MAGGEREEEGRNGRGEKREGWRGERSLGSLGSLGRRDSGSMMDEHVVPNSAAPMDLSESFH